MDITKSQNKQLPFVDHLGQNSGVKKSRRAMTPGSKRKLNLVMMTDTMLGNNHEHGKIIKRLIPLAKSSVACSQNKE